MAPFPPSKKDLFNDDGSKQQINAPVQKLQTTLPADKPMEHGGMKH